MNKMGKNEDTEKSIEALTEVINLDPCNAEAYTSRAWLYLGNNDYNNAIADFTEVIRLAPCSADAYYWRACLCCDEDAGRAIVDLTEVIRLAPYSGLRMNSSLKYINVTVSMTKL